MSVSETVNQLTSLAPLSSTTSTFGAKALSAKMPDTAVHAGSAKMQKELYSEGFSGGSWSITKNALLNKLSSTLLAFAMTSSSENVLLFRTTETWGGWFSRTNTISLCSRQSNRSLGPFTTNLPP